MSWVRSCGSRRSVSSAIRGRSARTTSRAAAGSMRKVENLLNSQEMAGNLTAWTKIDENSRK